MAQHDYNLANQSGADFRADLNNALSAIVTVNSGATAPSTTFSHQLWVDTSSNVLKIRNAANDAWVTTGVSITADNTFAGNLTGNVTGNLTGDVTGNADTATALETARTINGTSFDGTANISFDTDSVSEGSSNLYYTSARFDSAFSGKSTSDLTEGTNLYYTDARFDTRLATKDTDDLTEGTNLYFTNARVESYLDAGTATPTFASAVINTSITGTAILDDDTFGTASATTVSTSESIKAYVDSQIGSVDTLAEILANGNTTGGTDIAFGDNDKAIFGTGSDLEIFHDGSNSRIREVGTGSLLLDAESLYLRNTTGDSYLQGINGGAVNIFYDGSVKLATTSSGVNISGTVNVSEDVLLGSNGRIRVGSVGSLSSPTIYLDTDPNTGIYFPSVDSLGFVAGGTERLTVNTTGIDVTGTVKASTSLMVGSTDAPARDLEIKTTNPHIRLTDTDASGGYTEIFGGSGITTINADKGQAVVNSALKLSVDATDGLTIDSNHNVDIPNGNLDVTGTLTSDQLVVDGNTSSQTYRSSRTDGDLYIQATTDTDFVKIGTQTKINALLVDGNGDISFYDDTGTSQNLKWDASADTLNFVDNAKATFGASNDLEIYHDGSSSYIVEQGQGSLIIRGGLNTYMQNTNGVTMAAFGIGGTAQLRYNGSTKLVTSNTGIDVTGNITSTASTGNGTFNLVDTQNVLNAGNKIAFFAANRSNTDEEMAFIQPRLQSNSGGAGNVQEGYLDLGTTGKKRITINPNGDISFYDDTGSTQGLFWDASAESLGIGTTAVGTINSVPFGGVGLHVKQGTLGRIIAEGSSRGELILNDSGASTNLRAKFVKSDGGVLSLGSLDDNGTPRQHLAINNSGNVGIGTSSPNSKLESYVSGNFSTTYNDFSGDGLYIQTNGTVADGEYTAGISFSRTAANNARVAGIAGVQEGSDADKTGLAFFTHPSTATSIALQESLRISADGNVGIGTDSPQAKLDVLGADTSGASITWKQGTRHSGYLYSDTSGVAIYDTNLNNAGIYLASNNRMDFRVNGSERMRLNSTGLGIGTTSPSEKLHVLGNAKIGEGVASNSAKLMVNTVAGQAASIQLFQDSTESWVIQNPASATALTFSNSNTERMRIDSSGNIGIGTTSPSEKLDIVSAGSVNMRLNNTSNNVSLSIGAQSSAARITAGSGDRLGLGAGNTQDILNIASGGNVGIGTASPAEELHVFNAGNTTVQIQTSGGGTPTLKFTSPVGTEEITTGVGSIRNMVFRIGGSERARFDASGELLAGKTSADNTTAGHRLSPSGFVSHVRSGDTPMLINRLSSNGGLILFRKDGSDVGSIGTVDGDLLIHSIASGHKGLRLGNGYVAPTNNAGATEDNTTDLGLSGQRFKDLYLSGGVQLGGTGAANKLDDYEEGTWTPTLYAATTGTNRVTSIISATYTKIGRLVRCKAYLAVVDGTALNGDSGAIQLGGLPFTAFAYGHLRTLYSNLSSSSITGIVTGTVVGLRVDDSQVALQPSNINTGSNNIMIDVTFEA